MHRPLIGLVLLVGLMTLTAVISIGAGRASVGPARPSSRPVPAARPITPHPPSLAPADLGIRAQWVIDENAKPGADGWQLGPGTRGGYIEGYTDRVSAQQGDKVTVFVSTGERRYHVEAYRIGFYGGRGARLVWTSPVIAGSKQSECTRQPVTNMVECRWQPSLIVQPDAAWPPGAYLMKLTGEDGGPEGFVSLTLRDDASRAAYLVQSSVTTWQGYNDYGGFSLYAGQVGKTKQYAQRSRVVSFDRPYALGAGSGDFLGNESPLVTRMEERGLDVTYSTDIDLHQRPELVVQHKAFISQGHDEYWTARMRAGVETARDQGVNLAFLGANAVFRQIRLEPSPLGPDRRQVNYKDAASDPMRGRRDAEVTVDWRQPPVTRPESTLIGQQYECNPVKADMVVADPSAWVFAGTGLKAGDRLKDVVGSEYDRYSLRDQQPPGAVQVLAHSPVRCAGRASYADMTYYSAPSGAGVFSTGTNLWVNLLAPACPGGGCPHDDMAVRITDNVLDAFGEGPAGNAHPSRANYDEVAKTQPNSPPTTSRSPSRPSTTALG